jgi:hypothetical protein
MSFAFAWLDPLLARTPRARWYRGTDVGSIVARERKTIAAAIAVALATSGCAEPATRVVFTNAYPAAPVTTAPVIVYRGSWQAVALSDPLTPGASSDPQDTVAASPNTAYALLAPGWNPASGSTPEALVAVRSRAGFAVHLGTTVDIPVSDADFDGDCAAGSHLPREEADFITQRVFADDFAGRRYDPATCTTSPPFGDGGAAP